MIAASLIDKDQSWILMSVILAGVALGIFLEQRYRWAARISGPVLGLLIAMTLSTIGVMPTGGPRAEDLLLSVNATLGGAPSAVAMAVAKGWPRLVLPAMLVGIWGYVIGTALGVAIAELLRESV